MVQRSTNLENWSLILSRLFFSIATVGAMIFMFRLGGIIEDQKDERLCFFVLDTQTDRLDSEINVKQAQIFEAAILRPAATGGATSTPEVQRLGRELQVLISSRATAYQERDAAARECV